MSECAFAQGVYRAGQVQGVNIQAGTRLSGKVCSVCVHYKYLLANYVSDGCNVVDLDPMRPETFSRIRNEFEINLVGQTDKNFSNSQQNGQFEKY